MALQRHREDRHGNVVAQEGTLVCQCGCKYWENDKCIDCGMTPERLWIIQNAGYDRLMQQMNLNIAVTTMLHYNLPWLKASVSDDLDLINIQKRLSEARRYDLVWEQPTDCTECHGTDNDHYLSCSVWDFNRKVA